MWPLSVNSGSGSKATKSPILTPSDSQSARVVPRGHQRQHAAADDAIVGEDADAAALGEAAGPAAHRRQAQAAVVLDLTDDGANGVQVRGNRAVRAALLAFQGGADSAATGQFEGNAQLLQPLGNIAHDGVSEAGGAGNGEHFQQDFLQVIQIRFEDFFCSHVRLLCFVQQHISPVAVRLAGETSARTLPPASRTATGHQIRATSMCVSHAQASYGETTDQRSAPPSAAAHDWPGRSVRWLR
jgi:hypothetical protein